MNYKIHESFHSFHQCLSRRSQKIHCLDTYFLLYPYYEEKYQTRNNGNFPWTVSFCVCLDVYDYEKSIIISLLLIYRPNEIFKLFSLKNVIFNYVVRKSYLFACNCFPINLFTPLLFSGVSSFQINCTGSEYVWYRTIIMKISKILFLFEKKLSKYNLRYGSQLPQIINRVINLVIVVEMYIRRYVSTKIALEWDEAFKNLNDPSGRAVARVHDKAYT